MILRHVLVFLVVIVAAACGGNSTGPSGRFDGTWVGMLNPSTGGVWESSITFNQAGTTLTGNWGWALIGNLQVNDQGSLTGTADGNTVAFVFHHGTCNASANGTRSGTELTISSGGFTGGSGCRTGSFTMKLTKQN